MPYPTPDPDLHRRVQRGVDWLHEQTGVARSDGIAPLADLAESVPARMHLHAVPSLTYTLAAQTVGEITGQDLPPPPYPDAPIDGFLQAWAYHSDELNACILVNNDHRNPVERRRFTTAHELGHLVLHVLRRDLSEAVSGPQPSRFSEGLAYTDEGDAHEAPPEAVVSQDDRPLDTETITEMEREANAFAAALLMPDAVCRALAADYRGRYGELRDVLARRLASDLLVSKAAMRRRLHDLSLGR